MLFKRNIPETTADFDGKTVSLLPELAGYGENLICDSVRRYFCGEREVQLFYQTRFYDTDRQTAEMVRLGLFGMCIENKRQLYKRMDLLL